MSKLFQVMTEETRQKYIRLNHELDTALEYDDGTLMRLFSSARVLEAAIKLAIAIRKQVQDGTEWEGECGN